MFFAIAAAPYYVHGLGASVGISPSMLKRRRAAADPCGGRDQTITIPSGHAGPARAILGTMRRMTRFAGCAVAVVLALAPAGARGDEPVSEQFRRAVAAKGAAYVAARDA